jgi:hypothetical protein
MKERSDRRKKVFTWLPWILSVILGVVTTLTAVQSCVIRPNLDLVYQSKAQAKEKQTATKKRIDTNCARIEDHEARLTKTEALMDRVEKTLTRVEEALYKRRGRGR